MTEQEILNLTYEQALSELEKVVETLESGSAALDRSIELYSLGAMLKNHCQEKLRDAEEKVSVIMENDTNNTLDLKPLASV
jgi:exodeoxyribonuclease VII small subunit